MSEIKVNSVVNSTGDNDSGLDLSTNDQVIIKTANSTAVTVDSSQNTKIASNLDVGTIRATNGTSAMTINSSGIVIPKGVIMQVKASNTDQAYTTGSDAKVEWESVEVDTISGWDSTNHRYTPSVAGYYMFGGNIRISAPTTNAYVMVKVLKNGDDSSRHTTQLNHSSDILTNGSYPIPSGIMQLNGSSDYIEVFVGGDENMTIHDSGTTPSYFFAKLVHAT